ncbi:zinc finger protein Xfin [Aedes aegypti]|uniref:Uncharacterized protein n=1 Tax=Aedes aegypti TaxID=7159 RepID=A0A1S4FI42_AEDAE|nr:zinc finger protein Xfin [Aedes aegypti]
MDIKTEPGDYRNPYEVCRLCLSEEALNDVFDEEGLHQWISDYLSIMVSFEDTISKIICSVCRVRVTEFHQFRIRCQEVQTILRSMVQNEEFKANESTNKSSETKSQLLEMNAAKEMECEVCHKMFKSRKLLTSHKKIHEPRKHVCTHCGKLFARRQHLIKHTKTHVKDKEKNEEMTNEPPELPGVKLEPYEEQQVQPLIMEHDSAEDTQKNAQFLGVSVKLEPVAMPQEDVTQMSYFGAEKDKEQSHDTKNAKTIRKGDFDHTVEVASSSQLKKARVKEANTNNQLQCDICQKTYKLGKTMRAHKKNSHGIKEHSCPVCERPFALRHALKRHLLTHQSVEERQRIRPTPDANNVVKPFVCDICQKAFKRKGRLWEHQKKVHGPRNHECHICGFRFTMRDELARHVQRHTRNRDRKEDFRPLHLMNRKETSEIMNEDIKKEPTEEERDSQDDRSSSLQTDQKSTTSLTECEKCQKVFQSQKSLWLHYKFAHKPKNLKCSVCNVVFVSCKRLEKHMLTNHRQEDGSYQPLKCSVCNRAFSSIGQLKRHALNHGPRKYCCSICSRSFTKLENFELHMASHKNLPDECAIPGDEQCLEGNDSSASESRMKDLKNRRLNRKAKPAPEDTAESRSIQQKLDDKDSGTSFQEATILFEAEEFKIEPE